MYIHLTGGASNILTSWPADGRRLRSDRFLLALSCEIICPRIRTKYDIDKAARALERYHAITSATLFLHSDTRGTLTETPAGNLPPIAVMLQL